MRKIATLIILLLITGLPVFAGHYAKTFTVQTEGAWEYHNGAVTHALIIADGYCMVSIYEKENKKFIKTWGGTCNINGDSVVVVVQFDSQDKQQCGQKKSFVFKVSGKSVKTNISGKDVVWAQVDAGNKYLAGNWRITQRKQDDKLAAIPLRPRRTLKLLTATRFQWAAINIETCEFSGTGGGTYTFNNGTYTENIDFFSRDDSRVGVSLSFDGKLDNGNWIHSGLSSKGDPVYEIWSRFKE